jgi:hypothetical protein
MNCEQARETLLDSLIEPVPAEVHVLLEDHLLGCEACRRFAGVQRSIDARLTATVPTVSLSAGFQSSVREKLDHRKVPIWAESLPDIAHLAGCALGILLLLLILPQYSRAVLVAGSRFTVVTYFVQAVVRSSVDRLEPDL